MTLMSITTNIIKSLLKVRKYCFNSSFCIFQIKRAHSVGKAHIYKSDIKLLFTEFINSFNLVHFFRNSIPNYYIQSHEMFSLTKTFTSLSIFATFDMAHNKCFSEVGKAARRARIYGSSGRIFSGIALLEKRKHFLWTFYDALLQD